MGKLSFRMLDGWRDKFKSFTVLNLYKFCLNQLYVCVFVS
jgi:hypothetical protein